MEYVADEQMDDLLARISSITAQPSASAEPAFQSKPYGIATIPSYSAKVVTPSTAADLSVREHASSFHGRSDRQSSNPDFPGSSFLSREGQRLESSPLPLPGSDAKGAEGTAVKLERTRSRKSATRILSDPAVVDPTGRPSPAHREASSQLCFCFCAPSSSPEPDFESLDEEKNQDSGPIFTREDGSQKSFKNERGCAIASQDSGAESAGTNRGGGSHSTAAAGRRSLENRDFSEETGFTGSHHEGKEKIKISREIQKKPALTSGDDPLSIKEIKDYTRATVTGEIVAFTRKAELPIPEGASEPAVPAGEPQRVIVQLQELQAGPDSSCREAKTDLKLVGNNNERTDQRNENENYVKYNTEWRSQRSDNARVLDPTIMELRKVSSDNMIELVIEQENVCFSRESRKASGNDRQPALWEHVLMIILFQRAVIF